MKFEQALLHYVNTAHRITKDLNPGDVVLTLNGALILNSLFPENFKMTPAMSELLVDLKSYDRHPLVLQIMQTSPLRCPDDVDYYTWIAGPVVGYNITADKHKNLIKRYKKTKYKTRYYNNYGSVTTRNIVITERQ